MNLPNEKFCVVPWISLEASPIGTVRPCCLAEDELLDDSGEKFNLRRAQFADIQTSQGMQKLRQQFIDGEQPETCRKCWREEASGRTSKRMHTIDRLRHRIDFSQAWTLDARPLMFLDLKLGNICNLKCRICGSWSSSTFAVEELADMPPGTNRKTTYPYYMLEAGRWPRANESFWQEIGEVSQDIRYIEFTGGEPFMIDEHFDLLQRLIDQGLAADIEIHYNTNGTQFPDRGAEIWPHFRTVEIAVSVDDVGARFEYQRSGAVWREVEHNIERFRELRSQHTNIQLQCCTTVNVYNVLYLEEVADWHSQQEFDFVYWNIMHEAQHLSVATLDPAVKTVIASRLSESLTGDATLNVFKRIIEFMNNGTISLHRELIADIQRLDSRRNESLRAVAPELAQLLNYPDPE